MYVHSNDIVHADIEPQNIIVSTNYEAVDNDDEVSLIHKYKPMLLDFGIACRVNISCDKPVGTRSYFLYLKVIINRVI